MSLEIGVRVVTDVLLADGWHSVADKSFHVDSYEWYARFEDVELPPQRGLGFHFMEHTYIGDYVDGTGWVSGPLTAVLAVKYPQ